jgi:hypothetical protein
VDNREIDLPDRFVISKITLRFGQEDSKRRKDGKAEW